jgi:DNA-binding MarR family transcriptional regulator
MCVQQERGVDRERYGRVLMRAARYAARIYNRHLADASLSASQHGILEAVGTFGPVALQDLADELVIERSALQRTLQPLKTAKLVQSTMDPIHKKRSLYQITTEGQQRLELSATLICTADAEIAKFLALSDMAAIRDNLLPGVANQDADPFP